MPHIILINLHEICTTKRRSAHWRRRIEPAPIQDLIYHPSNFWNFSLCTLRVKLISDNKQHTESCKFSYSLIGAIPNKNYVWGIAKFSVLYCFKSVMFLHLTQTMDQVRIDLLRNLCGWPRTQNKWWQNRSWLLKECPEQIISCWLQPQVMEFKQSWGLASCSQPSRPGHQPL